jgi:hypothetical protein
VINFVRQVGSVPTPSFCLTAQSGCGRTMAVRIMNWTWNMKSEYGADADTTWPRRLIEAVKPLARRGVYLLIAPVLCGARNKPQDAFSPLYSVKGLITYTRKIGHDEAKPRYWPYSVAEDRERHWRITIRSDDSFRGTPLRSKVSIAYDGTNVYSLTDADVFRIDPLDPFHLQRMTNTGPVSVGKICPGPYPIDSSSVVGTIWLAYLSGACLDPAVSKTRLPDLAVSDARMDPMAWSCDFVYELLGTTDRPTLKSGRFDINPAYVRPTFSDYPDLDEPPNSGTRNTQLFYSFARIKALKRSTTVAVYVLEGTTNIDGVSVPTRFRVEVPTSAMGFGKGYLRFDGLATNCQAGRIESLLPPLRGSVTMRDRRMRVKVKGAPTYRSEVVYVVTNDVWATDTNDPRVKAAASDPHAGWRRIYSGSYGATNPSPKYVRLLIIFLLILPVPVLALGRYMRVRQQS